MRAKLIQLYYGIQASYWFIPLIMAILAIILSFVTNYADRNMGVDWLKNIGWLKINQPEGARAVLSTIAGSMITVAGVTFSMTIVSVSFASAQFGPRLIGNFMRDKGNQLTLGTFIATFVYCLMILRSVVSAEAGSEDATDLINAFVPHISLLVGLCMALASVIVLIYFIHHIPETINISNITSKIGNELREGIRQIFPESIGDTEHKTENVFSEEGVEASLRDAAEIQGNHHGFIEALDEKSLLSLAKKHDLLLRLEFRPGDFSTEHEVIMLASPKSRVTPEIEKDLRQTFAWGKQRTPAQNILFLLDELLEMIARALSPGVNDPYTAINCMNWLKCALSELGRRNSPDHRRYDEDGNLRVIAYPVTFRQFADRLFNDSRQYISADRNASLHMLKIMADVGIGLSLPHQATLLYHAKRLKEACDCALICDGDKADIDQRYEQLQKVFSNPSARRAYCDDQGWLGGKA